jgi:hypothetical protein
LLSSRQPSCSDYLWISKGGPLTGFEAHTPGKCDGKGATIKGSLFEKNDVGKEGMKDCDQVLNGTFREKRYGYNAPTVAVTRD